MPQYEHDEQKRRAKREAARQESIAAMESSLAEKAAWDAEAEALLAGIKSRKVGAACLDVYEEESELFFEDFSGHIVEDDTLARLISMPNVLLTSHQAFLTEEALENIAETTVKNLGQLERDGCSENELCYHCGDVANCRAQRKKRCF